MINRNILLEIMYEWNPWEKEISGGILRENYLKRLERLSKTGEVITISGIRRSGKSTLLKQFMNTIKDKETILYINLEESRFYNTDIQLLHDLYDLYRTHVNPTKKVNLLLDEVQKIYGWERFVRSVYERGEANEIIISGSSRDLSSKEYATLLTGRHIDMKIYPLSFEEFLIFNEITPKASPGKRKVFLHKAKEFLEWGGFPKITLIDDKLELLSMYFTDIINRDIIERYKIKEAGKLKDIAHYLVTNAASLHSANRIAKLNRMSHDTVERFFYYFEESYLFHFLKLFSFSLKQQLINPRKVYSIDNGFLKAMGFRFSRNAGKQLENAVFRELVTKGKKLFYWKSQGDNEIDFLIHSERKKPTAVQVCFELDGSIDRELKALKKIDAEQKIIISWDLEDEIDGVKIVPFWKWALESENF